MRTQVLVIMISVISWTTVLASKGNFCKPLLDYSEKKDRIENVTVCRTKMEKKCEDVRKKLCLNVTEMKCKVELFPNCTMDWEWEDAVDFNMTMKFETLKECTKIMVNDVHEKTVYHCKNVTKQHCTTVWKVNAKGEKVWDGNEDDCRDVTWEECNPVKVNVTIPAPRMDCTDRDFMYPGFENITTKVMVDTMDCTVERKAVCSPAVSRKCEFITYSKCRQVPTVECFPAKEVVPYQEEIHKQWCLLDQKENIDLESEVKKIAGNPNNFPFEKVGRQPRELKSGPSGISPRFYGQRMSVV